MRAVLAGMRALQPASSITVSCACAALTVQHSTCAQSRNKNLLVFLTSIR